MSNMFAVIRLLFLLLCVAPATPFCTLTRRIGGKTRRIRTRRLQTPYNNADPYLDDEKIPPTVIGRGSKICCSTFTSTNSIIVEGELDVNKLECGQQAEIHVTGTGILKGQIYGGILVTVDGKLEGSVECFELVVGPGGMVTGDVACRDVIIRPGGIIGGQLSCENMKSERDIFHETKTPLDEVVYKKSKERASAPRPDSVLAALRAMPDRKPIYKAPAKKFNTDEYGNPPSGAEVDYKSKERASAPRDSVVAALRAMSDRQTTYEVPLENVNTDEYGNPLIGAASNEQVLSLRRNRDAIFATRDFLDQAMARKNELLPEWAQNGMPDPQKMDREEAEKYSLKNVLNDKNRGVNNVLNQNNQGATHGIDLRGQGSTLSRSGSSYPDFSGASGGAGLAKEEERNVAKRPEPTDSDDYDSLPDFLR